MNGPAVRAAQLANVLMFHSATLSPISLSATSRFCFGILLTVTNQRDKLLCM